MSSKNHQYVCQNCGATHSKWAGKCNDCGSWNSIELEAQSQDFSVAKGKGKKVEVVTLDAINATTEARIISGIGELDRTLGGGIVVGSAVLLGGDPGIGKSTLLLELAIKLESQGKSCVYVTGEESVEQIRLHASRLKLDELPRLKLLAATNVSNITATLESLKADVVIIDSIQTMFIPDIPSSPGTVSQVRLAAFELISFAKARGIAIIFVGHVTKEGQIAGPKVLEHMVDAVLYFEGEKGSSYRILRSAKNRFGSLNEIGVFEMGDSGLTEVTNPSLLFLSERKTNSSGSIVFASLEGTRPLLIEVQALVSRTNMAAPRRAVVGWDINRLSMMIAVLATRFGINLHSHEVYLNIVGGLRAIEPAADLAVVCALISAFYNRPMHGNTVVFGEVGLSGEVRRVNGASARLKEASKLGFKQAIIPADSHVREQLTQDVAITEIHQLKQLKSLFAGVEQDREVV
jgi:DNA repair protein RadA/Sms